MATTTYGSPYVQSSDLVSGWPTSSLAVADRIDDVAMKGNGINAQTGTTYTTVLTDAGKTITTSNAAAVTVTIPTNASVAYEIGSVIQFLNIGVGALTIAASGGVTINNNTGTTAQYGAHSIIKTATDTWYVVAAPVTPSGLVLITETTITASASTIINNCFTSTYANYLLVVTGTVASSGGMRMLMRVGGVNAGTNYNWGGTYLTTTAEGFESGAASDPNGFMLSVWGSGVQNMISATITNPAQAKSTLCRSTSSRETLAYDYFSSHTTATAYDGLTLNITGGMTGTLRLYGLQNSL